MAKKSELLTVIYLDDVENTGRSQVMFNIRPESFNRRPQFMGVSVPANPRGQQKSEKAILAEAQKQYGKPLAIGYVDEGLTNRSTFLYDPFFWTNEKVVRPGLESYGTFWEMKPVTAKTEADGVASN